MSDLVAYIICIIMGYFAIGAGIFMAMYDVWDFRNPLWKLPFYLLWPIAAVATAIYGIGLISSFYIKEVKQYYKEKSDEKRL